MNRKNLKVIVLLAVVITLLAASGCAPGKPVYRVGELQTRSQSVPLDGAQPESVEIGFGLGMLKVSGGASDLLQATFNYNVDQLNPQVAYQGGTLSVLTPDYTHAPVSLWNAGDFRNEWNLQLNDSVPMKMHFVLGAGGADLQLGSLSLNRLDLDAGAGPVFLDLTGNWQADLDAVITGGLGEITVRLPSSACARVDITRGLGGVYTHGLIKDGSGYVNQACGTSKTTLRIDIGAGVGAINLETGG